MNALTFLVKLRDEAHCCPWNNRQMLATNSDLRRWIMDGAVLFNGERMDWKEEIDFPLHAVVFFPKSNSKRVSIFI